MATFTAKISNTGNVAAQSVNVTVNWPAQANLVDLGDYETRKSDSSAQARRKQSDSGQPTAAAKKDSPKKGDDNDEQSSDKTDVKMQSESFVIDSLGAGETAEFTYAVRTDNLQELPTKVEARYVCTVDAADQQAQATAEATALAMARVKIVRLPALQLAVIDDEDPVKAGTKVTYTITVWNEGDANAQDVQIVANLPGNLEFDSADGPTQGNNEGGTIKFDPIKTMAPGDREEYTVTCTPTGDGNVRFEAALTSKMLKREVVSEEPTRLFGSSSN